MRDAYLDFLRPSLASPHYSAETGAPGDFGVFTQADALEKLRHSTFYKSIQHVKTILTAEVFPNIAGPFAIKARFLGQLVADFMRTVLGVQPPSDRDSYFYKRVDVSGFLMAELFQSSYNTFRKNVRNGLDRDFNYGPWRHTGTIQDLVNANNLNKLFDAITLSETFQKSMKGAWGPQTGDPESAIVQDLSRVSYIGTMSHLRRVNLPLDRSIKVTSPHRLHAQQWGIMCPFESPDGASIGYLKNKALLTHITSGTDPAPIRAALRDLGVVPAHLTSPSATAAMNGDATRVYVNGDLYGITRDPAQLVTRLRLLRRNGLVNPFVSVSWTIKTHDIRIMTDAGRCARPLFIGGPEAVRERLAKMPRPIPISAPASAGRPKGLWFDMLLGTRLNRTFGPRMCTTAAATILPTSRWTTPTSPSLRRPRASLSFWTLRKPTTLSSR
jgi:DNA-directed RNA polymerase II subunit RPB2